MKKLLFILLLASCSAPQHIVYEGRGLVVTGVILGDNPERGKYIYITQDLAGEVIIWSDGKYNLGDTLKIGYKQIILTHK